MSSEECSCNSNKNHIRLKSSRFQNYFILTISNYPVLLYPSKFCYIITLTYNSLWANSIQNMGVSVLLKLKIFAQSLDTIILSNVNN